MRAGLQERAFYEVLVHPPARGQIPPTGAIKIMCVEDARKTLDLRASIDRWWGAGEQRCRLHLAPYNYFSWIMPRVVTEVVN